MTHASNLRLSSALAALSCFLLGASDTTAHAVTIETLSVGHAGNGADTTGYGAVPYAYRIGATEVTVGQYTEFLSAVADADPRGLYDTAMASDLKIAGI